MKGYKQGDMSPEVKDYQKPMSNYSQSFDQSPLTYVERQNKRQNEQASKLRGQKYDGKY